MLRLLFKFVSTYNDPLVWFGWFIMGCILATLPPALPIIAIVIVVIAALIDLIILIFKGIGRVCGESTYLAGVALDRAGKAYQHRQQRLTTLAYIKAEQADKDRIAAEKLARLEERKQAEAAKPTQEQLIEQAEAEYQRLVDILEKRPIDNGLKKARLRRLDRNLRDRIDSILGLHGEDQ